MVFNLTNIHIFTMWLFSDVGMAHSDFPISNEFYTPTTCFLTFNLCAVVGNLMAFVRFVSLDCIKSGFLKVLLSHTISAFTPLAYHSGVVEIPLSPILPALQLQTIWSRTTLAYLDALGLCLLGGISAVWLHRGLLFFTGYDVLPKVTNPLDSSQLFFIVT